ncbi:NAD-dependent epimerase/dehydratase family protein [Coraliomargarita sp. W4R53]
MENRTLALPMPQTQADNFLSNPSNEVTQALAEIHGDIMVLGAGGKMGLHICSMIQRADKQAGRANRVIAVSRFSSVHSRELFEQEGITTIACDLEDPQALQALPSAPNIIFMAGAKFGTADQPDILKRMNEELPKQVAQRFAGARCLVFSTGCVYAMVGPESLGSKETDPTDPPGDYAKSCLMREQAFAHAAQNSGSKVALIRLNYSTEFRYGVLVDIAQKVLKQEPIDLNMGWVNVIWQRDAVDQILQSFPLANTEPLVLNITGEEVLKVRDLAEQFGQLLNQKPRFINQEANTVWLNNAAKSHRLFGAPQTPLGDMMKWTAAWLQSGSTTFGKPTGFDNREGKF